MGKLGAEMFATAGKPDQIRDNCQYDPSEYGNMCKTSRICRSNVKSSLWGDCLIQKIDKCKKFRRRVAEIYQEEYDKAIHASVGEKASHLTQTKEQIRRKGLHNQIFGNELSILNHAGKELTINEILMNKMFFWVVNSEQYIIMIYMMVIRKCSPFVNITNGTSCLYWAAQTGNITLVKFILQQNYIDYQTEKPISPLDCIRIYTVSEYNTPLHVAFNMKHWDTAAYLWEKFTYEKRVYKLKL